MDYLPTLQDIDELYAIPLDYIDNYQINSQLSETLKNTILKRMDRRAIVPIKDLRTYDKITIRIIQLYCEETLD